MKAKTKKEVWTKFKGVPYPKKGNILDRCSDIYIEAPEEEAKVIFRNRFGHDPESGCCKACGAGDADYDICSFDTLEKASAYERGCDWCRKDERNPFFIEGECRERETCRFSWKPIGHPLRSLADDSQRFCSPSSPTQGYQTLRKYIRQPHVLVIRKQYIRLRERDDMDRCRY